MIVYQEPSHITRHPFLANTMMPLFKGKCTLCSQNVWASSARSHQTLLVIEQLVHIVHSRGREWESWLENILPLVIVQWQLSFENCHGQGRFFALFWWESWAFRGNYDQTEMALFRVTKEVCIVQRESFSTLYRVIWLKTYPFVVAWWGFALETFITLASIGNCLIAGI